MNGEQAHKVFYMSDEDRWKEVKLLSSAWRECECRNGVCPVCITRIDDIEEIADMALAAIDGPSR